MMSLRLGSGVADRAPPELIRLVQPRGVLRGENPSVGVATRAETSSSSDNGVILSRVATGEFFIGEFFITKTRSRFFDEVEDIFYGLHNFFLFLSGFFFFHPRGPEHWGSRVFMGVFIARNSYVPS
jgi:hypothetical protein